MYSLDIWKNFTCRAMLLCGTSDLPAKDMVYNMRQYNGEYGCSHCLQSDEQICTGQRGSVHIYAKQKQQGCKKRAPPSKVGSIVQMSLYKTAAK